MLDIDDAAWKVRSCCWREEEGRGAAPGFPSVTSSTRLETSRAAAAPRMTLPTMSQGAMSCYCFLFERFLKCFS